MPAALRKGAPTGLGETVSIRRITFSRLKETASPRTAARRPPDPAPALRAGSECPQGGGLAVQGAGRQCLQRKPPAAAHGGAQQHPAAPRLGAWKNTHARFTKRKVMATAGLRQPFRLRPHSRSPTCARPWSSPQTKNVHPSPMPEAADQIYNQNIPIGPDTAAAAASRGIGALPQKAGEGDMPPLQNSPTLRAR